MKRVCAWCGTALGTTETKDHGQSLITHGICQSCADKALAYERYSLLEFLETLEGPVIAVDGDGVVLDANSQAQKVLNKDLATVRGKRSGEIIECEYSRSPGGCGSTEHCQTGCVIRRAFTHTLSTGEGVNRETAFQSIFSSSGVRETRFVISTEKLGDVVMLRIDEVDGTDPSS